MNVGFSVGISAITMQESTAKKKMNIERKIRKMVAKTVDQYSGAPKINVSSM